MVFVLSYVNLCYRNKNSYHVNHLFKQGVSLGAPARQNVQGYTKFDSKAGRIIQVGTNSDQPFGRKGAVLGLFSHFPQTPTLFGPQSHLMTKRGV